MTRLQTLLFLTHLAIVTAFAVAMAGWWMLPVMVAFAACILGMASGLPSWRASGEDAKTNPPPPRQRHKPPMRRHPVRTASEDG